jgi:hypothetical protein
LQISTPITGEWNLDGKTYGMAADIKATVFKAISLHPITIHF